jgi:hypothetical protein
VTEYEKLAFHLRWLDGQGSNETVVVVYNNLCVPDTVTNCGRVQVRLDDDKQAHFDIELGPVNAMKLIEFLKQLPDEPDDAG